MHTGNFDAGVIIAGDAVIKLERSGEKVRVAIVAPEDAIDLDGVQAQQLGRALMAQGLLAVTGGLVADIAPVIATPTLTGLFNLTCDGCAWWMHDQAAPEEIPAIAGEHLEAEHSDLEG